MQMFVGYKVTKYNMILLQSETIVKVTGVVSLPTLESERERERGREESICPILSVTGVKCEAASPSW